MNEFQLRFFNSVRNEVYIGERWLIQIHQIDKWINSVQVRAKTILYLLDWEPFFGQFS